MRKIQSVTKPILLLAFGASVSAQTPDNTGHPLGHLPDKTSEKRQENSSDLPRRRCSICLRPLINGSAAFVASRDHRY
jgi:hypothetical protein